MANPNPDQSGLKPFTGADDPRRVNGPPKGTKHISTHIQDMLNDPDFELKLKDGSILREMPIKAIIKTAIAKSISGDTRAMEWLAKNGYFGGRDPDVATVNVYNTFIQNNQLDPNKSNELVESTVELLMSKTSRKDASGDINGA